MKLKKDLKTEIFHYCERFVREKLDMVHQNLLDIQEALSQESKSTAGDKHQTERAILQIRREELGDRMKKTEGLLKVLKAIRATDIHKNIGLGSLVFTTNNNFYLAIPAGCFTSEDTKVYCISVNSPIGIKLRGKREGDYFEFKGVKSKILKVE